jgi:magnesium transporter
MLIEERLARAFLETHPSRAARALEQMPAARAAAVLRAIAPPLAATVAGVMTPPQAARLLLALEPGIAATIVAQMATHQGAELLRALDEPQRERLLAAMPADSREPLARVLPYPADTAGAVMDPSIFRLPDDVIVADARARLRHAARDLLYYLYIVDREQRLVGVLDIPELLLAPGRDPVSACMHRDVDHVAAWMSVALVQEHPGWQRYHALPVVDEEQRLLGAIRYQTLRRIERELPDRGPDASQVTARALGELFQIGTTGLVAGVAATAAGGRGRARDLRAIDDARVDGVDTTDAEQADAT